MAVTIVTDSTAYLAEDIINEYDIKWSPECSINGEAFQEGSRYSNHDYYQRLRSENIFPPLPGLPLVIFTRCFLRLIGDTIIGVLISRNFWCALLGRSGRGMLPDRNYTGRLALHGDGPGFPGYQGGGNGREGHGSTIWLKWRGYVKVQCSTFWWMIGIPVPGRKAYQGGKTVGQCAADQADFIHE